MDRLETTTARQIKYIVEYGQYMNKEYKIKLLNLVMNYIIDEEKDRNIIIQESKAGLYIKLDELDDDIILNLYNVVYNRIKVLNTKLAV